MWRRQCRKDGEKHMIQKIRQVLVFMMRLLPLQKIIVFESHPDLSDNSYALYQELIRRGVHKRYRMYWIQTFHDEKRHELPEHVSMIQKEPATFSESMKRAFVLNCCRCIIDCNSFIYKRRNKQIRIHLGHGMPIKMDLEYSRKFGDCDKYMVQSEFWKDIYTKEIHVPEERLCYAGYPRNDVLVNPVPCERWQASVRSYRKIMIWMPTYRQHRLHRENEMQNEYPYGMPSVHDRSEMEKLQEVCKRENVLLLFRPHPVQELSLFENQSFSHIIIADDQYLETYGITLYELLGHTDALITDYSSVYFDYLLTDRPIALTIEDKDFYFQYFTLAFSDYKAFIKGDYVESFEELLKFIRAVSAGTDEYRAARMQAKEMFHNDVSGTSAVKIADMLRDEYGIRGMDSQNLHKYSKN